MRAAVIGGGSWGTALASVLAGNGWEVVIWSHDPEVAVAFGERLGDWPLGQPGSLGKHLPYRVAVEVPECVVGQHLLQGQRFEQVELEVAHIALVVAHR